MPEAAISKVWRKRTSLSSSASSARFLQRNWPIWAPRTRMVPSKRSSGRRTLALEIESTPTTRFSKVTGKMSAPCTPAARTRAKGAVRASAPGDVAADAAVAEELARGAEHRLAADREKALLAVGIDAADLEITERLARMEAGAMPRPTGRVRVNGRQLPARLADHRRARRTMLLGMRSAGDAMVAVGFPIEVRGELDQAAKARFALAQRLLGALLVRDVAADAAIALEAALGIEHRLATDRKPARAAFGRGPLHLEVAERLMTLEARAVVGPIGRREIERRLVPATPAEIRRWREAGLVLQQRRHEGQAEVGVLLPIPVRGELGELAKALLAFLQRLLGALVRADVAGDAEHDVFAARLVAQRHDARLHPTARAAQTNDLELQAARFAAGGALRQGRECRAMLGRHELEQAPAANRHQGVGLDHAQAGRVHVDQPGFAIDHRYALRLRVDDGAQACLARAQRMHDARLQRREAHRTLEGALAELSLDQVVEGAARERARAKFGRF